MSPVGAAGLAQFMPATWDEVTRQLGWSGLSARQAGPAIEAGAFYMARLHRSWSAPRPAADRHFLACAAYNAGLGNLLAAQRRCAAPARVTSRADSSKDGSRSIHPPGATDPGGLPVGYDAIVRCLPEVTGRHSEETITYVQRIRRWHAQLRDVR